MAKPTRSARSRVTPRRAASTTPKTTQSSPAAPAAEAATIIADFAGRWPALTDQARRAYDALATDAQRAELGGETRAAGVLKDAVAWLPDIHKTLDTYAVARGHYHPSRFAYFLFTLSALESALRAEKRRTADVTTTRDVSAADRTRAMTARRTITRKLERFAGHRKAERNELDQASGRADDDVMLRTSLENLAALARKWSARTDDVSRFLLETSGLTEEAIRDAEAAAAKLSRSTVDTAEAGRIAPNDTPAINLLEGNVLLEMTEAKKSFDEAHEQLPAIARLAPGPNTRRVLGTRHTTAPTPATPATPAAATA